MISIFCKVPLVSLSFLGLSTCVVSYVQAAEASQVEGMQVPVITGSKSITSVQAKRIDDFFQNLRGEKYKEFFLQVADRNAFIKAGGDISKIEPLSDLFNGLKDFLTRCLSVERNAEKKPSSADCLGGLIFRKTDLHAIINLYESSGAYANLVRGMNTCKVGTAAVNSLKQQHEQAIAAFDAVKERFHALVTDAELRRRENVDVEIKDDETSFDVIISRMKEADSAEQEADRLSQLIHFKQHAIDGATRAAKSNAEESERVITLNKELSNLLENINKHKARAEELTPSSGALSLLRNAVVYGLKLEPGSSICDSRVLQLIQDIETLRSTVRLAEIKVFTKYNTVPSPEEVDKAAQIVSSKTREELVPFEEFIAICKEGQELNDGTTDYIVSKYSAQLNDLLLVESVSGETLLGRMVQSPLVRSNFSLKCFVPHIYGALTSVGNSMNHLVAVQNFGRFADFEAVTALIELFYPGDVNFIDSLSRHTGNSQLRDGALCLQDGLLLKLDDAKGVEEVQKVTDVLDILYRKSKLLIAAISNIDEVGRHSNIYRDRRIIDVVLGIFNEGIRPSEYESVKPFIETFAVNRRGPFCWRSAFKSLQKSEGVQYVSRTANAVITFLTLLRNVPNLDKVLLTGVYFDLFVRNIPENVLQQIKQMEYDSTTKETVGDALSRPEISALISNRRVMPVRDGKMVVSKRQRIVKKPI
ncbi:MAG: hypothetical protein LBQ43_02305 [Holosporales bacterium]|nr:hypothetical protein [Holosporales bacterium]